jgi:hypothetical protein
LVAETEPEPEPDPEGEVETDTEADGNPPAPCPATAVPPAPICPDDAQPAAASTASSGEPRKTRLMVTPFADVFESEG